MTYGNIISTRPCRQLLFAARAEADTPLLDFVSFAVSPDTQSRITADGESRTG